MAQGVKESEVSYQMAFSKEQLRKVIGQYPAREVKKGLEHLYRKVEKHLSEDVNLLQVNCFIFSLIDIFFINFLGCLACNARGIYTAV